VMLCITGLQGGSDDIGDDGGCGKQADTIMRVVYALKC
jgi:hypothetical protein